VILILHVDEVNVFGVVLNNWTTSEGKHEANLKKEKLEKSEKHSSTLSSTPTSASETPTTEGKPTTRI
jgi:hypothetical protein